MEMSPAGESPGRSESNLTKKELAQVYIWFDDGLKPEDVIELTSSVFGKPKKKRMVYNYREEWKNRKGRLAKRAAEPGRPLPDDPVDWVTLRTSMSFFGISRETLPMIRATQGWVESTFSRVFLTHLTYRSAKWYAYVLDYAPSISSLLDVWAIGEQYAHRDRYADFSDEPMERLDLDAWLTYRPWLNKELEARYLGAIKDGSVTELPDPSPDLGFRLAEGQDPEGEAIRWVMGRGMLSAFFCRMVPEQRHKLPSQQLEHLISTHSSEGQGPFGVELTFSGLEPIRIKLG